MPSASDLLRRDLAPVLDGEVRFDAASRALYSTDASVYQITPLGVVVPRSIEDVVKTVEAAARHGVSLTPRGGGTSQAGQAIGAGLVLDTSKYLNRILAIDPEARTARVQPGVVLDELNAALKPHNLRFAPDVSSASRATVGGMMANNSSGARSVLYGKTIDHVRELQVILSDGALERLRPLSSAELHAARQGDAVAARAYRTIPALAGAHAAEIGRRFPKVLRRVGGYNLDAFVDPGQPVDLSRIMVGSEGTLGFVVEATVGLVPLPAAKALLTAEFDHLLDALAATPVALRHSPAAVEVMDDFILSHTRDNAALDQMRRAIVERDGSTLLCIELYADHASALSPRLEALARDLAASGYPCRTRALTDPAPQARVWSLREAALGLSMAMKGDGKAVSFVEDTAVAPEHLRDYIERFAGIIDRHGTTAGIYAHASVGCLHVRPGGGHEDRRGRGALRGHCHRSGRPGARVRRRALGRARGRPGPGRLQREDVRARALPGLPHGEADLRPAGPLQPRPHRRHAAHHVAPALRRRLCHAGSRHLLRLRLVRRFRPRGGDVQRRGRVPQDAERDDVPVVHGDARRGALHARARQRAAPGHERANGRHGAGRPRRARGARPLPRMPRLQERVSRRGGRGSLQERVPGRLLPAPRRPVRGPGSRAHPRAGPLGQPVRTHRQRPGRQRPRPAGERGPPGHRPAAPATALGPAHAARAARPRPVAHTDTAGGALRRHLHVPRGAGDWRGRLRAAGPRRHRRRAGATRVLWPATHLERPARRRARAGRAQRGGPLPARLAWRGHRVRGAQLPVGPPRGRAGSVERLDAREGLHHRTPVGALRGAPRARGRGWSRAARAQARALHRAAARALPPARHGPWRGGDRAAVAHSRRHRHRSRCRLLRHGRIVRLHPRALRGVARHRRAQAPARRPLAAARRRARAAGTSCRHQVAHFAGVDAVHPAVLLRSLLEESPA
jgi:FAD/FMN-containing dehydrogenase